MQEAGLSLARDALQRRKFFALLDDDGDGDDDVVMKRTMVGLVIVTSSGPSLTFQQPRAAPAKC